MLSGPKAHEEVSPSCFAPSAFANSRIVGTPFSLICLISFYQQYIFKKQKGLQRRKARAFRPSCSLSPFPILPILDRLPRGRVARLDTPLAIDYRGPSICFA